MKKKSKGAGRRMCGWRQTHMEGAERTLRGELRLFFPVTFPYYSILPYPGLYIGWRCPHYLWDCFRIGDESKCFCGHLLREHQIISGVGGNCLLSCVEMCERTCVCWFWGEVDMGRPSLVRCWSNPLHRHIRALQHGPVPLPHVLLHPITPRGGG